MRLIFATLSLLVLSSTAAAQRSFFARPTTVSAGWSPNEPIDSALQRAKGLPGVAMSPDGRLLISSLFPGMTPFPWPAGWWAAVLRPEAITLDPIGVAQFPIAPSTTTAWSNAWLIDKNLPLPNEPAGTSIGDRMYKKQWLAVAPDPAFAHLPCPFPSDASGNPGTPGTPSGANDTYQLIVVAADNWQGVAQNAGGTFRQPSFTSTGPSVIVNPIGIRTLRVTVSAPGTPNASVASSAIQTTFRPLEWTSGLLGQQPILGIEPTLSRDGRLLVFQGNSANQNQNVAWDSASTKIDQLLYSFNPTPGAITGWSEPRSILDMNSVHGNQLVNGVLFSERYPIGAKPLVAGDGTSLSVPFCGAYPWMSLDATDIVFSARTPDDAPLTGRRRSMCIVGRSTSHAVRYIDGPLNPDRNTTHRVLTAGTGLSPGIWQWGGDKRGLPLPYQRTGTVIPLFDAERRQYGEISVRENLDQDYLVAWDMNENLRQDSTPVVGYPSTIGWKLETTKIADLSGNFVTGQLSASGAFFPADITDVNGSPLLGENYGVVGRSVIFDGSGSVTASGAGLLASSRPALSVECWFRQRDNTTGTSLINKGNYALEATSNGQVRAWVVTTAGLRQTPWSGTPMTVEDWRHVAMTYDGNAGQLQLYVDGVPIQPAVAVPLGALVAGSSSPLLVGPAGINIGGGAPNGWLAIDQVLISRVVRTADEIARDAFLPPSPPTTQLLPTSFSLPLGLDRAESLVPTANVMTRLRIDLGEALFKDGNLSPLSISCAKCHASGLSFTDGIARRAGSTNPIKLRNAPTVLNRLFSSTQFWDGRALSLEAQATHPLFNVDEMNATTQQVMAYLNTPSTGYPAKFAAAFNNSPPSIALLADALASYQRALVAGNSRADQFEAGSAGVLSTGEKNGRNLFFGKARCFGCHSGSNYTDERFHVALVDSANEKADGSDLGLGARDGRTRSRSRFKTPTLRNLRDTAPYFHDGSAASLQDVVERYDKGGKISGSVDEEIFPLGLTPTEKQDLVSFLLTLSGGWTKL